MSPILNVLKTITAECVLDVAAGRGGFSSQLLEGIQGIKRITCVDINPINLLNLVESIKDDRVQTASMNAARLGFTTEEFDLVALSYSLHHLSDVDPSLKEILRVVKPGGWVIINEMHRDTTSPARLTHVLMHDWWAAIDMATHVPHFPTFTRTQLLDLVGGLRLKEMRFVESEEPEGEVFNSELISEMDFHVDTYIRKCGPLANGTELATQGQVLRTRLHTVGFASAPILLFYGRKAID